MASAELPSWGDGVGPEELLPAAEQVPQLAEYSFDPLLRERLATFFRTPCTAIRTSGTTR
jgi:hypothetical protein